MYYNDGTKQLNLLKTKGELNCRHVLRNLNANDTVDVVIEYIKPVTYVKVKEGG